MRLPALPRSPVPDLLYEDQRDRRIADIAPLLDRPERLHAATRFHRVTVFLTYRCQLRCGFCKTIARSDDELRQFPQKAASFDLAAFTDLLTRLGSPLIDHLHFTGGEATLVPALPDMIRVARDQGVRHLSVTSNGALSWVRLEALLDSGISEIRVSVHARDPLLAPRVSKRPEAWPATIRNLRALVECRKSERQYFITNTVISHANRHETAAIVRFLIEIGADDVKLIAEVDQTDTLGTFPGSREQVEVIERLLEDYPAESFPLLRRKLRTVFSPDAVGLRHVDQTRGDDWRCYVPLTERTVDRLYYYPCSVYLREGAHRLAVSAMHRTSSGTGRLSSCATGGASAIRSACGIACAARAGSTLPPTPGGRPSPRETGHDRPLVDALSATVPHGRSRPVAASR